MTIVEGPFRVGAGARDDGSVQPDPVSQVPPRVIVVDADDRVRESLIGLLGIGERLEIVGSAGGTEDALGLATLEHPDIVVVDPRLPEMDGGLAFIRRLRMAVPRVRIIVMSRSDCDEEAALAAGVDGFVRKTFRPSDLQAAILAANGVSRG
jgi:DNA-binding NarL/FixJ family response regulator